MTGKRQQRTSILEVMVTNETELHATKYIQWIVTITLLLVLVPPAVY